MVFTSPVTNQHRMTQGEVTVKEGLWFVGHFKVVLQREEWKVSGPVPAPAAVAVGARQWQEEAALSLARISYFVSPACAAMLNMFLSVNSHFLPFFFLKGDLSRGVCNSHFLPSCLPPLQRRISFLDPSCFPTGVELLSGSSWIWYYFYIGVCEKAFIWVSMLEGSEVHVRAVQ